jgi:hypothetical protein
MIDSPKLNHADRQRMLAIKREIDILNLERLSYLKKLSDPEKTKKLTHIGSKLYLSILEAEITLEISSLSFDDFVSNIHSLDEEEKEYFDKFKNDNFYSQDKLFDKFMEHPKQTILSKKKLLGKRSIFGKILLRQQTTLNKVLKFLWGAKLNYFTIDRLAFLEKEVDRYRKLERVTQVVDKKTRCIELLNLKMKQADIAEELGVSPNTIKRWKKQHQNSLNKEKA